MENIRQIAASCVDDELMPFAICNIAYEVEYPPWSDSQNPPGFLPPSGRGQDVQAHRKSNPQPTDTRLAALLIRFK